MQQDIRKTVKNFKGEEVLLSTNHQDKMQQKLMQELHQKSSKKKSFKWLSIAASLVLILSFSLQYFSTKSGQEILHLNNNQKNSNGESISLGKISPELKTIEKYYTNSINYEISQLHITDENSAILDQYLIKISELTKEYKSLSNELKNGINDATIEALISNLQLRLQLLQRLKKQLKELKHLNTNQNETQIL